MQSWLLAWMIYCWNISSIFQLLTLIEKKTIPFAQVRQLVHAPVQERHLAHEVVHATTTASKPCIMSGGYLQFLKEDWIWCWQDVSSKCIASWLGNQGASFLFFILGILRSIFQLSSQVRRQQDQFQERQIERDSVMKLVCWTTWTKERVGYSEISDAGFQIPMWNWNGRMDRQQPTINEVKRIVHSFQLTI